MPMFFLSGPLFPLTNIPLLLRALATIDPQAWLADVFARINDHAIHRFDELLPWNWVATMERRKVAA
jgi:ABC-type multidrug transport system permease subunit